jgi:hypothetical protein
VIREHNGKMSLYRYSLQKIQIVTNNDVVINQHSTLRKSLKLDGVYRNFFEDV